jgi:predicted dehydrogenase
MADRSVGVVMNGVTGRMGQRQHLARSLLPIRDEGGVTLSDGTRAQVELLLVGRNQQKLRELAERSGVSRWTADLDTALSDPEMDIYFDTQLTAFHEESLTAAMQAGKHVYSEKPIADSLAGALRLARIAKECGLNNGVVHDKLFLPGMVKLKRVIESGFFGRILSVRGDFGYWVFEGDWQEPQRPSWNYRAEDGGGIVSDMFSHWNYLFEDLFGVVEAVTARAVTHIPERWNERQEPYRATADDSAYAIFELAGGVIAQVNSSWCVRVHRDELVEFQVDGTHGSAVAGLHGCVVQHRASTPRPVWNPDEEQGEAFREQWLPVPENAVMENGFKAQWQHFIRNVVEGVPHRHDFLAGARGVRLAEAGLQSSAEGRRIELGALGP